MRDHRRASRSWWQLGVLGVALLGAPSLAHGEAARPAPPAAQLAARKPVAPWAMAVEGGASLPFPRNASTTRRTLDISFSYLAWQRLELSALVRLGFSDIADDVVYGGRVGLRLGLWRFAVSLGCRVGYVAMHVHKQELGELSVRALLLNPSAPLSLALGRHVELRANLATLSLYRNELWLVAWEPSAGAAVRF